MDGKKKLSGWQFGVLTGLLILMLSTMFMPLFNIGGEIVDGTVKAINKSLGGSIVDLMTTLKDETSPVLKKWVMDETKKNLEKEGINISDLSAIGYSESDIEEMIDEYIDEAFYEGFDVDNDDFDNFDIVKYLENVFNISVERTEKGYSEFISYIEKEKNIKLTNISPFYIMTKSFSKFIGLESSKTEKRVEDEEKTEVSKDGNSNEKFNSLETVYNSIRLILIVIYTLCLVVLILTIIGFAASWSKTIPVALDMIYGVFAIVMLIVIRGTVSDIFNSILEIFKALLGLEIANLFNGRLYEMLGTNDIDLSQNVIASVNKVFSDYKVKFFDVSTFSSSLISFGVIIAFIVAIIIVVFSFISIFVGGKKLYDNEYMLENDGSKGFPTNSTPKSIMQIDQGQQQYVQKQFVQQKVMQKQPVVKQGFQTHHKSVGKVVCTKGVANGQGFQLTADRKLVIGKNSSKVNLVINCQRVSNIHCSIRYNEARNTYIVTDHSTNGTFVNGVRMVKDVAMEFPAGTILSLADGNNQITLE